MVAKDAINAGIDMLQMREKNRSRKELLVLGTALASLCKKNSILFIVNDDPLLAKKLNADGVHLGQEDLLRFPLLETRNLLGKDKIIGLSTHSPEQFKIAQDQDFDYCAFGPVFFTKTKSYYIGTNDLGEVFQMAKKPVICIGGITLRNVKKLVALGATNIAVIRAITEAGDIGMAVKSLKDALCT